MGVEGSRVGIVGGSIAGCAAAIALRRAGCDVTVFERSRGDLRDRGVGIVTPLLLREEMVAAGYLDADMPACPSRARVWVVADGLPGHGRIMWRQPFPALLNNWAVLWGAVRSRVPDSSYRDGTVVDTVEADSDGATVCIGGRRERFDVVAGADGYRSIVRPIAHPGSRPLYAGYVLWRGSFDESRLAAPPPDLLDGGLITVCFPGGHGVFYFIPGTGGATGRGRRRVNWAVYTPAPDGMSFDAAGSLPPGSVTGDALSFLYRMIHTHLPPYWSGWIEATDPSELSLQPIYDQALPAYVSSRLVLTGDASTITRPHTGSGVTKALQDALALERACATHDRWDEVLAAYGDERCPAGNDLVELGRRLGRCLVENTPDWPSMTETRLGEMLSAAQSGSQFWLYSRG